MEVRPGQVIKGDSPLKTGLLFLSMTCGILLSSNLPSVIRLGPRVPNRDGHAAGRIVAERAVQHTPLGRRRAA